MLILLIIQIASKSKRSREKRYIDVTWNDSATVTELGSALRGDRRDGLKSP